VARIIVVGHLGIRVIIEQSIECPTGQSTKGPHARWQWNPAISSRTALVRICIATILIGLAACGDAATQTSDHFTAQPAEECAEPENPYGDGGGHDAGFNWGQETGRACTGNSQFFIEGCEEYQAQLRSYEECEARKNR
jgi:hypothetical protein